MQVDIRPLKAKALSLPDEVANLILSEPDSLESEEFFIKSQVWNKILRGVRANDRLS